MDEEDYDSEDDDQMDDAQEGMREIDSRHVLNYQTDSDDDDEEDDLGKNLEHQKEMMAMSKEAWGKSKKNFYKSDSDSDSGSEDEEELAKEAMRLQKIRQ